MKASEIIKGGGVIIAPTETVYGILCNALDETAVNKVANIKGRNGKPFLVNVSSMKMLKRYFILPEKIEELVSKIWPGPLTVLLETDKFPKIVSNTGKVGVRIPDSKMVLEIIERVDLPVISTSANFSGNKSPASFEEIDEKIKKRVDFVVDGGECPFKKESTIIDFVNGEIKIIRKGAIDLSDICEGA